MDGRRVARARSGIASPAAPPTEPLRLAQLRPRDFHQILKAKFALPDR